MQRYIYHVYERPTAQNLGLYTGETLIEAKREFARAAHGELEDITEDIIFEKLGRVEDFEICRAIDEGSRCNPLSELLDGIGPHHGQYIPDRLIRGLIDIEEETRKGCPFAEEALDDINQLFSDWSDSGYPEIVENWIRNKELSSQNKEYPEGITRVEARESLMAIAEDLESVSRRLKQLIKSELL
jgi:hypothetical protein